eukprot:m.813140 g.813140  ORF g.813140 m.813140 type:complete len:57 (+) comp59356_c0_seq2:2458-2628(+)
MPRRTEQAVPPLGCARRSFSLGIWILSGFQGEALVELNEYLNWLSTADEEDEEEDD